MRVNLGEGAGKIETYDLAAMIMPDINLEKCSIELKDTKNYKEAFGTLESLNTVNSERKKLDLEILEALGFEEKAEREKVLLDLYRSTYKLIDARIQKAQSLKGVKAQRNKVSFTIYVDQLKEILLDDKYTIKNKSSFAKHLKKIVRDISSDIKLQQKILDAYWKEKYGLRFNEKEIAESEQQKLF